MAKIKLELQDKTDEELRAFAASHARALAGPGNAGAGPDNSAGGHPDFPEPDPPVSGFDPVLQAFTDKLREIKAEEIRLQTLRSDRERLRRELEEQVKARGAYVEKVSKGEEARILSAGFQVQATGAPTTSLPAPDQVAATMGDQPGGIDLSCHAVPRARAYIVEVREHSDHAAPGPWRQGKMSSRSSMSVTGLVSGQRYAFRVRALGPNELESPWSAEAVCMAP